jgi:glycosyltransferase involved in cell wall biosynthesis
MVSIITSTYNDTTKLGKTAISIINQTVKCQWIVIDAGSNDGIWEFYNLYMESIDFFLSEPDNGIFSAWNKALKEVTGDWILFLGAGDYLYDQRTIERVMDLLRDDYDICYGKVSVKSLTSKRTDIHGYITQYSWQQFRPRTPHHQGVFHNKRIFEKYYFDESYRIGGDAKLVLSITKESELYFMDTFISYMIPDGVSYQLESLETCYLENKRMVCELGLKRKGYLDYVSDFKLLFKVYGFKIFGSKIVFIIDFVKILTGKNKSFYER